MKKTEPKAVLLGEPFQTTISISNPFPDAVEDVRVRLEGEGFTFVRSEPPPIQTAPLTWRINSIAPGETASIDVTLKPSEGAHVVRNIAKVTAFRRVEALASNLAQILALGGLNASLALEPPILKKDQTAAFILFFVGEGPGPVEGISLDFILPKGVEFIGLEGDLKVQRQQNGVIHFEPFNLAPGEKKSSKIIVRFHSTGEAVGRVEYRVKGFRSEVILEALGYVVED